MKLTQEDHKRSGDIDYAIRTGDFQRVPLDDYGTSYQRWYARLLTTLTLVLGDQEIVYSQTDHDATAGAVRFVVVTHSSVIVADVSKLDEETPSVETRVVGRRSLTSIRVGASMAIDQDGSSAYGWPGRVEITAAYSSLDEPLVFADTGYKQGDSNTPGPILALLSGLQQDLDGTSTLSLENATTS